IGGSGLNFSPSDNTNLVPEKDPSVHGFDSGEDAENHDATLPLHASNPFYWYYASLVGCGPVRLYNNSIDAQCATANIADLIPVDRACRRNLDTVAFRIGHRLCQFVREYRRHRIDWPILNPGEVGLIIIDIEKVII